LEKDPWQDSVKKYQIGQVVKGKVSKVMPFGVFVELDDQIQGLAHILELSHNDIKNPEEVVKAGEEREFKIISIEPQEHRLGLSIKALTEKPAEKEKAVEESTEKALEKVEEKASEKAEEKVEEPKTEEKLEEKTEEKTE
jgi:ribosomal protein S1